MLQDISSISIKQFLMVLDSRDDLHHFFRFRKYQALQTKVELFGEQGPISHLKK